MMEEKLKSGARAADAMDLAAGLNPAGEIFALRAQRPEFLEGAEECRVAVLTPKADLDLSAELRMAVAHRVALTSENPALISGYTVPEGYEALALGETPEDPRLAALAAHTDMIARNPALASADHLQTLQDAGFSVPQVIALSELLAYVCFQIRVAHGLKLLEVTE